MISVSFGHPNSLLVKTMVKGLLTSGSRSWVALVLERLSVVLCGLGAGGGGTKGEGPLLSPPPPLSDETVTS